jgi:hypothetical protein
MSIKNLLGYEVRELFGEKLTIVVPKFPSFRHSILAGPDFSPRAWKGGVAKAISRYSILIWRQTASHPTAGAFHPQAVDKAIAPPFVICGGGVAPFLFLQVHLATLNNLSQAPCRDLSRNKAIFL